MTPGRPTDQPPSFPIGYAPGPVLGRGGSGTVYRARQLSTGREVAVKVLDVDLSGPEAMLAFDRERRVMGTLASHPHVVPILDAGLAGGRPWIAMALFPGGSLARSGAMGWAEVVAVLSAVASALEAAHARGVVHCDVKPANVLLGEYGQPALADFGIARFGPASGRTGAAYTLDHAAPEVVGGERPTPAADVFSLGTTAWQLLHGRPPFRRPEDLSPAAIAHRLLHEPLPAFEVAAPPALATLVSSMTAKDPRGRPSASDVRHALETLGSETRGSAPFPAVDHTDLRPELASLTRAAGPARHAAPIAGLAAPATSARRDPAVALACGALVVVVLSCGGLLGARIAPRPVATIATTPTIASAVPSIPSAPPSAMPTTTVLPPAAPGAGPQRPLPARGGTAPQSVPQPVLTGAVIPPVAARPAPPVVAGHPAPPVVTTSTTTTTTTTVNQVNGGGGLFPGG